MVLQQSFYAFATYRVHSTGLNYAVTAAASTAVPASGVEISQFKYSFPVLEVFSCAVLMCSRMEYVCVSILQKDGKQTQCNQSH